MKQEQTDARERAREEKISRNQPVGWLRGLRMASLPDKDNENVKCFAKSGSCHPENGPRASDGAKTYLLFFFFVVFTDCRADARMT